jgi:EAL domain-containing protein (putative c-di-GMP-specific phosphodiesterase class I)
MGTATLLDRVVAPGGLAVFFQPVLDFDASGWHLLALEALVRGPEGTNLRPAEVLFAYVRRKGAETEVDRACATAILAEASRFGPDLRLNMNVHGVTLERDPGFVRFLAERLATVAFDPHRLTMEIVENSASAGGPGFIAALADLRELGVRIALDDIGLGHSNYRMVLEVRPDFLKIDRYLVSGCSVDPCRRAIVGSIGHLAERLGARAVAEGIETARDLRAVLSDGISSIQGFLLSGPGTAEGFGGMEGLRRAVRNLPMATGEAWSEDASWLSQAAGRDAATRHTAIHAA